MGRWICPECDREFGRTRQSHVCVPGCTVDDCFAPWPPKWRHIYDAIIDHAVTLGPLHVDAVRVGVFLKAEQTVAEVRPKARSLSLELVLPRVVADPRISRTVVLTEHRVVHIVKLLSVSEVDDQVRDWLTEAYDAAC